MVAAPVVSKPVLPASLPPLGPPPAIAVEKPVTASGPVIHKPAPLDENLNSPWKRKDSKPDDLLEETMDLPTPVAGPKEIPSLPPLAPPASAPLPTLPTLASLPSPMRMRRPTLTRSSVRSPSKPKRRLWAHCPRWS
jgi:hypothetical protein